MPIVIEGMKIAAVNNFDCVVGSTCLDLVSFLGGTGGAVGLLTSR